jgi:hypothetical protein
MKIYKEKSHIASYFSASKQKAAAFQRDGTYFVRVLLCIIFDTGHKKMDVCTEDG